MWWIPIAGWLASYLAQRQQAKQNQQLAQFQANANQQYLQQQLDWNSPANQMLRYQQAGMNPALAYGQGSPGNQSAPLSYPDIARTDYQSAAAALSPAIMQSVMMRSQVQAVDAKTRQTYVMTALNKLQEQVLQRNPLLDAGAYNAIIDSLKSAAEIKAADASMKTATSEWFTGQKSFNVDGVPMHGPAGVLKMETELKLLEQRFNLGGLDQKIKAEVLQSKDFQNAILEVQKKWMTDAEVTPQHILQFIQLLLMKLL